jgi:hypothetical protein
MHGDHPGRLEKYADKAMRVPSFWPYRRGAGEEN